MSPPAAGEAAARKVFLIATEESGDRLGAELMRAIRARLGRAVGFEGVGGAAMAQQGLATLFPIEELSIVGFAAVVAQLPKILALIQKTAAAVIAARPDVLVIIDSPDFTHRVARRVRRRDPAIPIVDYVSPSVWAWRQGRARAMRAYVDHVLALLPFEPEAYRRLDGPPCSYVGHPLAAQLSTLRPDRSEQARRGGEPAVLLVLPGSRRGEIRHHLAIFGEALGRLRAQGIAFDLRLPTTPHLAQAVREGVAKWPVAPKVLTHEDEKRAAFRIARAALAKSGTVTLELALSGVPMVAAYRVGRAEAFIARRVIKVASVILANLVVGENVVPELIQDDCTADKLACELYGLMADGPARRRQLEAFERIEAIMALGERAPGDRAADIVLATLRQGSPRRARVRPADL